VLGVSCILAALIIASSSFAWFTSKDEVTNRLTASSDYGVSIVESFTPPKNWIPGQEINKDVYAVNTGNIEAFVKEELSGILDYSYEYKVPTWDAQCVTLDQNNVTVIDGATMNEAGAFLAWTNADGVPYGVVVSSAREADKDNEETVKPRWTPTESGDYIFRRSIGTKHVEATGDDPTAEGYVGEHDETVYTYAGYRYDKSSDTYYKIVIGNDSFRAANDADPKEIETDGSKTRRYVFDISVDSDSLGVDVDENGVLQSAPTINYVKVADLDPANVSFIYDDTTSTGTEGDKYNGAHYLKVRVDNTNGDMAAKTAAVETAQAKVKEKEAALLAAQAAAGPDSKAVADAEADYYNALYEYYTAVSRAHKTAADYAYAQALRTATDKLYQVANNRYNAETTKTSKKETLDNAKTALDGEVDKEQTDEGTETTFQAFQKISAAMKNETAGIGSTVLVDSTVRAQIEGNDDTNELKEIKRNIAALDSIWGQIAGENGILSKINQDYQDLQALDGANPDAKPEDDAKAPSKYEALSGKLKDDIDTLQTLLANYKNTYNTFTVSVDEAHLTGLNLVTESLSAITAYSDAADNGTGSVDKLETRVKDTTNGLDGKIAAYKAAYNDYYDYVDPTKTSGDYYQVYVNAWESAVNTYNDEVTTAKNTYDGTSGVGEVQNKRNNALNNVTVTSDGPEGKFTLVNDGLTLVNDYSAHKLSGVSPATDTDNKFATSNADPTIKGEDADYRKYVGSEGALINPEGDIERNTFTQLAADPDGTAQELQTLESAVTSKENTKNSKLITYNDAKAAAQAKLSVLATAEQDLAAAKEELAAAQAAQSQASSGSSIKIDVVLDKDVVKNGTDTDNATWVFDTATDNSQTPTFYYNRIVGAGETTNKLVDKLVFCDDVKASDYKELQFDLNVKLDSAQAVYDDATQSTILTTAVDANDAFALDAEVGTDNSTVTWTAPVTP
jgi:alternate signal-mediated exported protein